MKIVLWVVVETSKNNVFWISLHPTYYCIESLAMYDLGWLANLLQSCNESHRIYWKVNVSLAKGAIYFILCRPSVDYFVAKESCLILPSKYDSFRKTFHWHHDLLKARTFIEKWVQILRKLLKKMNLTLFVLIPSFEILGENSWMGFISMWIDTKLISALLIRDRLFPCLCMADNVFA